MLITDNKTLQQYCEKALIEKVMAFDTEFMRDKTYYPKLSLVQIATKDSVFAVDMLCGLDYLPLRKLLSSPHLLKVIHSARQDLELLYNFFGIIPQNLLDTQTAALFLGYKDSPSFELLAADFLNVKVSKALQFSDWLIRPLSDEQLQYAITDANLLYELFFKIEERLNKLDRFAWALEESNLIKCGSKFITPIETMLNKFAGAINKESDLLKCYDLLSWREEKAKTLNVPRNYIIKEEVIIQLCHKKPLALEDLLKYKLHPNLDEENLYEILKIMQDEALDMAKNEIIKNILNNKKFAFLSKNNLFFMLKILVEVISKKLGIHEQLLATTTDILLLAHDKESRVNQGWRRTAIGNSMQDLKEGKLLLGFKDGNFFISG
ncbi:ribonuclease D [Holosporaceae bacterium 'Namur']|nr:ribonuclease D [Holosporaceae bacterium 'Namur']